MWKNGYFGCIQEWHRMDASWPRSGYLGSQNGGGGDGESTRRKRSRICKNWAASVPTRATHFRKLTVVVHSIRSPWKHTENKFPRHGNSELFCEVSPVISLDTASGASSVSSHRHRVHTWRAHRAHDLDVHQFNHRAIFEVVPIPVI